MANPTLNSIDISTLKHISNSKDGNIIPLPIPTEDSDSTETFDMLGVIRTITLSGVFTGTTATVKSKIESIEALIDGDQSSSVDLVTDEMGTKSVKVAKMQTDWNVGGVGNRAEYVITVIEGV